MRRSPLRVRRMVGGILPSATPDPVQNLRMRRNRLRLALGVSAAMLLAGPGGAGAQTVRTVTRGGASYRYILAAPNFNRPKPALLLLHGAGGHATDLYLPWREFAATHDAVLIAPELTR